MHPLVTVGIPTYNRPILLQRALECVVNQNYPNLEVIIADNCTPGSDVKFVVDSYRSKIKNLRYFKRTTNIGSLMNFLSIINISSGKYLMWLADDDEISKNYVSSLVQLLEDNPDASCAMGNWVLMMNEKKRRLMKNTNLPHQSPFYRAMHFVWKSDDAFFYGIHRTKLLQEINISNYWWPNRNVVQNRAYFLLIDTVLKGRVLLTKDKSVQWINHNYTQKHYKKNRSQSFIASTFLYVLMRINVHFMYWKKISRSIGILAIFPAVSISVISLVKEFTILFGIALKKFIICGRN